MFRSHQGKICHAHHIRAQHTRCTFWYLSTVREMPGEHPRQLWSTMQNRWHAVWSIDYLGHLHAGQLLQAEQAPAAAAPEAGKQQRSLHPRLSFFRTARIRTLRSRLAGVVGSSPLDLPNQRYTSTD